MASGCTHEHLRLTGSAEQAVLWRQWGPYLSERSWGTVREDYSADGDAWAFLPHDLARSKAYRWGEDGLAGVCDPHQVLCFALALWNGRDPILKERLFGLANSEGNHGEDVKELYYYLDNVPSHAYMRWLYKYPQQEFPYERLVGEAARRGGRDRELELLDTGIFDSDRYFDVFVEYAKYAELDLCVRIEAINRGPETARLHVLPHLWFRNTWSWGRTPGPRPRISLDYVGEDFVTLAADDSETEPLAGLSVDSRLGPYHLFAAKEGRPLFTDNETNGPRVFGPVHRSASPWVKDAFHRHLIHGEDCTNPEHTGTKAALHYVFDLQPGASAAVRLRLSPDRPAHPMLNLDRVVALRRHEADEFYAAIHPRGATAEERAVQRQALAGMLWNKQTYIYDVAVWLDGDREDQPPPATRPAIRNRRWRHLNSLDVLSMPDKWEYPWFAAWDLAFQSVALTLVDPGFAKEQLWLLLFEHFQHPSGQLPAYEWEFGDLNPPVHAWAVWRVYNMDRIASGVADRAFLERCFHKLLLNFTWWVNKVDSDGNNVFEGGFLGLDNIAVIDRSHLKACQARLEQSDATGWMGMFCLNLMRIALELAKENPVYEGLATKFFEHYVLVGSAMKRMGGRFYDLWSETDGFFYDVLRYPDGRFQKFRVRSLVGLIPFFAVERLEDRWLEPFRTFRTNVEWFLKHRKDLTDRCVQTIQRDGQRVLVLSVLDLGQMRRVLDRVWDEDEFLSPYGLRSLSRFHASSPFRFEGNEVRYEPAEAEDRVKGGNSNWRGPVWFPTSFLMIETLRKLAKAYGDSLCAAHCELDDPRDRVTLGEMASSLADRLIGLFVRGPDGRRAAMGSSPKLQDDPHFRDHLLFHEYFNAETGEGLGASHQLGWTGLVANLIAEWRDHPPTSSPGRSRSP
ncbi:MAG: glucosidase [Candidatus Riflebacteria bacterium]|nr:glucosidase [Candidatus Riflebacteria bacterium]